MNANSEQKYPVLRLTQDAYNALRQESENNPELYQDPQTDFHEVLRTHGITDSVEETDVFANRPIHLTPVTTNPRNRADAQALDFYNSLVGMTPSLAIDGRIWAWMTHFKLHSYCIERWPLRWNTDLTKHIRHHWFVENTGTALLRSNAASRTWWIAHTALKAARKSGGAFTAEQAIEDFAHYPEHYHTLMNYNFTRHPLVLAEFIRTLLNEAQGINRDGVRQLGRRLNLMGGTRLLDAIPREQLRAHIVTNVEGIMSDAALVSDRKRLRMNPTRVLSLGAGVQSTVLALLADRGEHDLPRPDFAIFADTGWEPPAVYEHLEWLKAQLSYEVITVSDGNIRDDILNGTNPDGQKFLDIPAFLINADGKNSVAARQCTSHYKLRPIYRYLREHLGIPHGRRAPKETHVEMWLGISADEDLRQKPSRYEWITNRYPLIQLQFSRAQLLNWFKSHYPDRDLPASSCIGCPYHSNSMWKQLKESDPASFKDAVFIDQALRSVPVTRGTIKGTAFLHRERIPLDEVDFSDVTNYDDLMLNECEGLCGI